MSNNQYENTSSNDSIVNDIIKVIYNGDNGKTIKNAILSKSQCSQYKEIELQKTKKVNNDKLNNKISLGTNISNNKLKNNKTLKNNNVINDITIKCFTNKKNIKKKPKIIISDIKDQDNNKKYSYLVVMMSNLIISFDNKTKKEINNEKIVQNTNKYINWIAIINDDKVDKNIINYSLNKDKGLHNFIIRIYKFPKNDISVLNQIQTIVDNKINKIIKKLKKVKTLDRIYTNNIIVINKKHTFEERWWKFEKINLGMRAIFSTIELFLH